MVSSELLPGPLLLRPDKLLRDDLPSKKRKKTLSQPQPHKLASTKVVLKPKTKAGNI